MKVTIWGWYTNNLQSYKNADGVEFPYTQGQELEYTMDSIHAVVATCLNFDLTSMVMPSKSGGVTIYIGDGKLTQR